MTFALTVPEIGGGIEGYVRSANRFPFSRKRKKLVWLDVYGMVLILMPPVNWCCHIYAWSLLLLAVTKAMVCHKPI